MSFLGRSQIEMRQARQLQNWRVCDVGEEIHRRPRMSFSTGASGESKLLRMVLVSFPKTDMK